MLAQKLEADRTVTGAFISQIRTPAVTLIAEQAGLDFIILDMEHGSFTYETMENICISCQKLSLSPIVRIPEITRGDILKPLEAGAEGLLIPRVESPDEAERAVSFAKYSPQGDRSLSSRRPHNNFGANSLDKHINCANYKTVLMAQIETTPGLSNAKGIVSTAGIDLVFLGPSDLGLSLENSSMDLTVEEAVDSVVDLCAKNSVYSGIHGYEGQEIEEWISKSLRLLSVESDINALLNAFESARVQNQRLYE